MRDERIALGDQSAQDMYPVPDVVLQALTEFEEAVNALTGARTATALALPEYEHAARQVYHTAIDYRHERRKALLAAIRQALLAECEAV